MSIQCGEYIDRRICDNHPRRDGSSGRRRAPRSSSPPPRPGEKCEWTSGFAAGHLCILTPTACRPRADARPRLHGFAAPSPLLSPAVTRSLPLGGRRRLIAPRAYPRAPPSRDKSNASHVRRRELALAELQTPARAPLRFALAGYIAPLMARIRYVRTTPSLAASSDRMALPSPRGPLAPG